MADTLADWMRQDIPALHELATPWSMIVRARDGDADGRAALRRLAEMYYGPVYRTLRSFRLPQEQALDLAQRFMVVFCDGKFVHRANRDRGSFRAFLRASLRNFWRDEAEKDVRRRGLSLPEPGLLADPGMPGDALDRELAWCVFDRAVAGTRELLSADPGAFEALARFDLDPEAGAARAHGSIAAQLGMELEPFRRALYRARTVFRGEVCRVLREGLDLGQSLEDEIRWLLSTLAGGRA